jgi:hypothetical protein
MPLKGPFSTELEQVWRWCRCSATLVGESKSPRDRVDGPEAWPPTEKESLTCPNLAFAAALPGCGRMCCGARNPCPPPLPWRRLPCSLVQMRWLTGVRVGVVLPSCVAEVSRGIGGSTITAPRKPLLGRLQREVLRPYYRARIAMLSRRHAVAA